jgi:hypothetical protein
MPTLLDNETLRREAYAAAEVIIVERHGMSPYRTAYKIADAVLDVVDRHLAGPAQGEPTPPHLCNGGPCTADGHSWMPNPPGCVCNLNNWQGRKSWECRIHGMRTWSAPRAGAGTPATTPRRCQGKRFDGQCRCGKVCIENNSTQDKMPAGK